MKVLKRDQVTEVVTKRTVFHSIKYKGIKYSRVLRTKVEIPYMDDDIIVQKPKIDWREFTDANTVAPVDKALSKELEKEYQTLSTREKNGDV